jgi:hypothetical protein
MTLGRGLAWLRLPFVLALVGCNASAPPPAKAASEKPAAVAPEGEANISRTGCEEWGTKFAEVIKAAFAREMRKCAVKIGHDAAEQDTAEKAGKAAFDKEIEQLKEKIVKGCSVQEGKRYISKDADCYMNAKELKDWKSCEFKTPFSRSRHRVHAAR